MSVATEFRLTAAEWGATLRNPVLDKRYLQTALGPDLADYLVWAEVEAQKAPRTRDAYERDIARACVMFPEFGRHQWGKQEIRDVLASFPEGSRPRAWAALSDFWNWQEDEDRIERTPMRGIRRPKRPPRTVVDIFTNVERARLVLGQRLSMMPVVDTCRMVLMLESGLRKTEARLMLVRDVNVVDRYLVVYNAKGGDDRVVAFGNDLQRAFMDFLYTPLPLLERLPEPDDYIFFSHKSTGVYETRKWNRDAALLLITPKRPMSNTSFSRWWETSVERAGVRYRKLHVTRHTYATDLLDATDDIMAVKDALGHRSLSSTEVYLHNQRSRLRKAADALEKARSASVLDG